MWYKILIILILCSSIGYSQSSDKKCKVIDRFNVDTPMDSLTVLPNSIEFTNEESISQYQYDVNTGNIFIVTSNPEIDSIEVCYQTLPFPLHHTYLRRDLAEIQAEEEISEEKNQLTETGNLTLGNREELFYTEDINKSGSLSRSISFGNAQNVVVNSDLNLQLEGKITDDINIRASITDQDVPYQPEGNTAQIQDFDNVFIELYNDDFSLIAGDVVLQNKESHFLRYYKNVQGGLLNLSYKVGENGTANTRVGASVAKGQFASILLDVREGVAGPYRIEIPDASRLAIILANSERVFLDGKQLQRGYDYDYVIDYDRAEITFTSQVLITQYSRVRIDVEYSDQNYGRGIFAFNHYQSHKNVDFFLNYYSERDNRNNPLNTTLTEEDKRLLADVGDSLGLAVTEDFQIAEFIPKQIQYELVDTLTEDMTPVEVFRYSNDSTDILYDVEFSEVGTGNGDYIRTNDVFNGIVFQWVSPVNGQPQGNYQPVRKIPAPNGKSMADFGVNVKLNQYESIQSEMAISTLDKNLYSELDADDDSDIAYKVGLNSENRKLSEKIEMNYGVSFERNGKYFNPIDRFRYIEFNRDWNYNPEEYMDQSQENIFKANVGLKQDVSNLFSYELTRRKRAEYVDGAQHEFQFLKEIGRLKFESSAFLMNNESVNFNSSWRRLYTDLYYESGIFVPGYEFNIDRNTIRDNDADSVMSTAMNYYEHVVYLRSNDTLKTRFRLDYVYREDQLPIAGELALSNISHTGNFRVIHEATYNKIDVLITYRNNQSILSELDEENEETINTRIDWYSVFLDKHLRSDLNYTVGSGRELRKEFIFIQVQTGQGTHTWRDDNGNGVEELNEFYLAVNPDEKNYAKIFVPTNEFVFAHTNNLNYRLNAEMPRSWRDQEGMLNFLSRFSNITSISSQRKITNQSVKARFLPFDGNIDELDLISSRTSVGTRVFFNRRDPRYGVDAGYNRSENKQLLSGGFEKRANEFWTLNLRSNINKTFSVTTQLKTGEIINSSDFLNGKNYLIQSDEITPQLSWQPNVNFRVSGSYTYNSKENVEGEGNEQSTINEAAISTIYNKAGNTSINASFKLTDIDFSGDENSPVGYELLEALQPGVNYRWSLLFQKKLLDGLQLTINYEGRKSENSRLIHIGRMQVSVLF